MDILKGIVQVIRNIASLPFLFAAIGLMFTAEFIAGKLYTWRGDMAGLEAVYKLRRSEGQHIGRKGFRQPKGFKGKLQ